MTDWILLEGNRKCRGLPTVYGSVIDIVVVIVLLHFILEIIARFFFADTLLSKMLACEG